MFYTADTVFEMMDSYGKRCQPFLFGIDFNKRNGFFSVLQEATEKGIRYCIRDEDDAIKKTAHQSQVHIKKNPVPFEEYSNALKKVQDSISQGRSYLTNLTFPTPIEMDISLDEAFNRSTARYTVSINGSFLFFSPETFVKIEDDQISSFPMKGTISANIDNAAEKILNDEKEKAEHATITDLIRNDLSMVSQNVVVEKYRYLDLIHTNGKPLLQVSSKITGELTKDWQSRIGTIFEQLLPAGSISGAPKESTLKIISESENAPRGFYTGVFGIFDGKKIDSCVMIRFMEIKGDKLFFYSGGGITSQSDAKKEYQEMIDKIYVPFN